MISDDLHTQVTAWMADDPDERDRAELAALLRTACEADDDRGNQPGRGRIDRPVRRTA